MLEIGEPVYLEPTGRIREAPPPSRTNLSSDISRRVVGLRNLERGLRRGELERIKALLVAQFELLASIPSRVEAILDTNPDTPIVEVVSLILPKKNKLSNTQREKVRHSITCYMKRRIHIRVRRVFERVAHFGENNQLEWFYEEIPNLRRGDQDNFGITGETGIGFYFFGKYPLLGEVEFEFDVDYVTCFFSNPVDYYRAYGNECGTDKGKPSAGAVVSRSVSIINSRRIETKSYVKPHEDQHVRNGYLLAETEDSIEASIKDEIIAYMTHSQLSSDAIVAILCKKGGLYHYDDITDWEAHTKMVERYVRLAFEIQKKFPRNFKNLLAVTEVRLWRRLMKP